MSRLRRGTLRKWPRNSPLLASTSAIGSSGSWTLRSDCSSRSTLSTWRAPMTAFRQSRRRRRCDLLVSIAIPDADAGEAALLIDREDVEMSQAVTQQSRQIGQSRGVHHHRFAFRAGNFDPLATVPRIDDVQYTVHRLISPHDLTQSTRRPENFQSSVKKDFFNTIRQKRTRAFGSREKLRTSLAQAILK